MIAYDRLIEDPGVFYITFDNVEVGRMQARAIYELVPEGNYVFIKGNQADANADFLFGGQMEVLTEATGCEELADDCAIVNVGESYTDNWDPEIAQENMENFLTQNDNDVQAVVASNDGMAGGVVAALDAQGLAGEVPVSGQDGDPAALNRVALGTQSVSVWKNAFALGQTAAEVALQLVERDGTGRRGGTRRPGRLGAGRRDRRPTVHHSWRRGRGVHHPDSAPHHPGEPERAHRRRDGSRQTKSVRESRPAAWRLARNSRTTLMQAHRVLPAARDGRGAYADSGDQMSVTEAPPTEQEQLEETPRRSLGGLIRATEVDTRMLAMLVALAVIWTVFHFMSGGTFLTPQKSVESLRPDGLGCDHGNGDGSRHRLPQHRPLGGVDARGDRGCHRPPPGRDPSRDDRVRQSCRRGSSPSWRP